MPDQPAVPLGDPVAVFEAIADVYDRTGVEFFGPIAADLVRAVEVRPGESALDLGCGTGAVTTRLAEAVRPGGRVLGLDASAAMLSRATRALHEGGLADDPSVQVAVGLGDAAAPPGSVAGDGWDVVTASLLLFFLPDPAAALEAWLGLAAPGGRIGVTTFAGRDPRWTALDDLFAPWLPASMRDARTSGSRGPFASDDGMEQLVTDSGWLHARTERLDVPVVFPGPESWEAFTRSVGQRAMWDALPAAELPRVRARAFAMLDSWAAADGSTTFTQPVRHTLARRHPG